MDRHNGLLSLTPCPTLWMLSAIVLFKAVYFRRSLVHLHFIHLYLELQGICRMNSYHTVCRRHHEMPNKNETI